MVQWFHHKPKVLLKGREVLMMKSYHIICPKCNNNHLFYRYGKDSDGYQKYLCRNCHHQFAPERPRPEGQIVGGSIRLDPYAERRAFCTTIMSIILTTVAAIRNAAIPFLNGKLQLLPHRLYLLFLESITSSVCAILFRLSLRLFKCFILVKTLSVILA